MRWLPLVLVAGCAALTPEERAAEDYLAAQHSDAAAAMDLVNAAIDRFPKSDYYSFRASLWQLLKQPERAIADYDLADRIQPGNPALYLNRGIVYFRLNRRDEAYADFSAALKIAPEYIEALLYRSRLRREPQATRDLEEARKLGAKLADGFYNDGVRAANQGDAVEAELMYGFALDLNPEHSRAHLGMARLYMERKQFAEAVKELDLAMPANLRDGEIYYHRGNARVAAGLGEQAFGDYNKALEISPTEPVYYAARGLAWHRVRQDYDKAKKDFDEALRLDARCWIAWYNRGVMEHELKDLDAAEKDLRHAGLLRTTPEGCMALGRVLHDRKEYDKALSLYRQALEIFKNPDVQRELLAETERTRRAKENP